MAEDRRLRVAFDVGGVISKYPDVFRALATALFRGGADVYVISDMHRRGDIAAMLAANGFGFIPEANVHPADFEAYGEACKAVLLERLGIDVFVDDFPAYVAAGCPVRLLVQPDLERPYYADDFETPGRATDDFGRRKRVTRFQDRNNVEWTDTTG